MAPITFIVIGPIGTILGDGLGSIYGSIYRLSPIIAGIAMGGLWQVFVMFGMHWGLIPIMMVNLNSLGYDTMSPMLLPAVLAQGGAALAVFFLTKNIKLKGIALSSTITSLFGITEPTVYGMTLPLKRPFIAACIGGAIGGAFVGFNNVKNFSFGLIGLLSLPGFIPPNSKNMAGLTATAIGTAMAFILAFVLTFILRFSEEPQAETITSETNHTKHASTVESKKKQMILASPLAGKVIPLTEVKDQVFSSNSLGKGVAIDPSIGELYDPADGTITTLFPTGHAVGITTTDGIEILMHIGLDTVELEGKGFNLDIKQEQKVKKGDRLVTFDLETIKTAGYSPLTPIVITNSAQYFEVLDMDQDEIVVGESLLSILK